MRIVVDIDSCVGHGRCNAEAPQLFTLDDLGYCALESIDVPEGLEDLARAGANVCPERAISIVE